tara:strand:+ start:511 stop:2769 length:2259 start_codon:yes stop_codon:yes gene_type:complete
MNNSMVSMDKHRSVGTRPERIDAKEKVTGSALFGTDIMMPGMLHGRILRSPHAHARIISINTANAESMSGVFAVVTANDLPEADDMKEKLGESTINYKFLRDNNLASDKVLYVGHAVAALAAETPDIAENALELIEVEYEILDPVLDVRESMSTELKILHEQLRTLGSTNDKSTNVAQHIHHVKGDPSLGFDEADVIIEREFITAPVHQSYLEPHAATATWGKDGNLTIYASTQGAFVTRRQVSQLLQYPMSKIKVIPTEVGGAFGGKNPTYVEVPASLLSYKTAKPVRVVMSREEVILGTGPGSGTSIKVKMGAKKSGKITAAQAELCYEAGAYPGSPVDPGSMAIFAAYDIPNGQIDGYDVLVNKPRVAAYRAPGAPQAAFACEQVIDELASSIAMDGIEFRMMNAASEGTERINGKLHKSIAIKEILGIIDDHPHYNEPIQGPYQGRGVAIGFWDNWGARSSVDINVNSDGTVNLISGSVDLTGSRTTVAMQAADVLEIPLEKVKSSMVDTDSISYADTSAGSRTTMATGKAAVEAAYDVIGKLKLEIASLWNVSIDSIRYANGVFSSNKGKDTNMTFQELAGKLSGQVTGHGNVNVEDWAGAGGGTIVDVEVDPDTGQIKILKCTVIQNAGKAIHPGQVEGQMQGGVVQGIGWALYEGYEYDKNGKVLNANLLDYKLPTALDVPNIDAVIIEKPFPSNPYGARGVGETPIISPAPAIANAVQKALGVRLHRLPMTPSRILEEIGITSE